MRLFRKGNIMLQCNVYITMHCLSTKLLSSYNTQEENKQIMKICWKVNLQLKVLKLPCI